MASPEFRRLDVYDSQIRDAFVPLLSELSSSFADMTLDEQIAAIETNVPAVLENPNATLLVHQDPDSGIYASTLTVNKVSIDDEGHEEGWVDDVSTIREFQKRGLGRAGMIAGHEELRRQGVQTVRLTSKPERAFAGNLYDTLGYRQGGEVWRAIIEDALEMDFTPSESGLLIPKPFKAVDCTIPTGHKAWTYGPQWDGATTPVLINGLREAHATLRKGKAASANYLIGPDDSLGVRMATALRETGYGDEPRDTRVYTLNLEQPAA